MKKYLVFITAITLCSISFAQSVTDLKGTWSGTTNTTVIGTGEHHPGTEPKTSVRFRNVQVQYIIDQQKGPNFSGKFVSPAFEEMLAGALSSDNKTGVMVDEDGAATFKLLGKNKMEVCYAHAKPTSMVAACNLVERK